LLRPLHFLLSHGTCIKNLNYPARQHDVASWLQPTQQQQQQVSTGQSAIALLVLGTGVTPFAL
jgi:hypothetical protein